MVHSTRYVNTSETTDKESVFDIVGPICETGDFIGKDRVISIEPNNILSNHGYWGLCNVNELKL